MPRLQARDLILSGDRYSASIVPSANVAKLTGREKPSDLCIVEAGENTAKQLAVKLR